VLVLEDKNAGALELWSKWDRAIKGFKRDMKRFRKDEFSRPTRPTAALLSELWKLD
jgi:hypothetical protein